jgi:hypothetical protein
MGGNISAAGRAGSLRKRFSGERLGAPFVYSNVPEVLAGQGLGEQLACAAEVVQALLQSRCWLNARRMGFTRCTRQFSVTRMQAIESPMADHTREMTAGAAIACAPVGAIPVKSTTCERILRPCRHH